jgi:ABC-type transport system substrate-binding protein
MRRCDFHFYTAGWSVGRFPTFLYGIYQGPNFYFYQEGWKPQPGNITSYYDLYGSNNPSQAPPYMPSAGPNYIRFCNYTFDLAAETFRLAKTLEEAKDACKTAQVFFQEAVATIPLWYVKGFGAYRVWSPRAPNGWAGGINAAGAGANNAWTLINLYPKPGATPVPTPTRVKWGGARPPEMINPIYSSWVWDWDVIDNAMGYLLAVNPINLADIPPASLGGTGWMAYDWEQTTWVDPADGKTKSKVRYYLRNDLVFHDGTPFTADDLVFAIEYGKKMVAWWYDSVKDFLSWYPVDPYTVDILMDVESYWSVYWIGGVPLLPKHIWSKVTDPKAFMPDPTLTGLGYWDFISWDATNKVATFNRNPHYFLNKAAQGFVGTPHIVYGPPWGKDFNFTVAIENLLANAPEGRSFSCSGWVHIRKEGQGVNETIAEETITDIAPETIIRLGPYNTGPLYKDQTIIVTYKFTITVTNPDHTEIVEGTYKHYTWSTYKEDLNLDMFVDGLDISPAARAFGSRPGHPRWNSRCDLNLDYFVDGLDISRVARNFGKASPPPP